MTRTTPSTSTFFFFFVIALYFRGERVAAPPPSHTGGLTADQMAKTQKLRGDNRPAAQRDLTRKKRRGQLRGVEDAALLIQMDRLLHICLYLNIPLSFLSLFYFERESTFTVNISIFKCQRKCTYVWNLYVYPYICLYLPA